MAVNFGPEIDIAELLSDLYLPETTFATTAVKIDDNSARVTHTLGAAQCDLRKSAMLRGEIQVLGAIIINKKKVDDEITLGHFTKFRLLAGHQAVGLLLAAGSHDNPMWWTGVDFVSFQNPAAPPDEMIATAKISQEDETIRMISGEVTRASLIHTRAEGIRLEVMDAEVFARPHLPSNAWLEVAAHFGGGAIAAWGEFPGKDYAPFYLGVGESSFPKELGEPYDNLVGQVTLNGIENLDLPGIGTLKVVSVNEMINKGTVGIWRFDEVEFGFLHREQLMEAIAHR